MRRVTIIASASGNGRRRSDVSSPQGSACRSSNWTRLSTDPLGRDAGRGAPRAGGPILAGEGWVVDGTYQRKLGTLVLDAADTVVWLDLPIHVWLRRLARRTIRRMARREELWNANRETLRNAFWGGTRSSSGRFVRTSPAGGRGRMSSPVTPWCGCALRARSGFLEQARPIGAGAVPTVLPRAASPDHR